MKMLIISIGLILLLILTVNFYKTNDSKQPAGPIKIPKKKLAGVIDQDYQLKDSIDDLKHREDANTVYFEQIILKVDQFISDAAEELNEIETELKTLKNDDEL